MNEKKTDYEIKILIAHNDHEISRTLTELLRRGKYRVSSADSLEMIYETVTREQINLIVIDQSSLNETAFKIIRQVRRDNPDIGILILTETAEEPDVLKSLEEGTQDYLLKPETREALLIKIKAVLEKMTMKKELTTLRQHIAMNYGFDNIVGISKPMVQIKETARRIAPTDITLLITGASGTGKELLARTIHHHSRRRRQPFLTIDCSIIPENLLEYELFGKVENNDVAGHNENHGLFVKAEGGTLFIDEIASLPVSIQPRLLRFFQYSEICPAGSSVSRKVDVRVMAATSRDLSILVNTGQFSSDLFYRLNVIPIRLPALNERAEDIEILTEYFLRKIAFETTRLSLTITRPAIDRLLAHTWPGNIRELENTLKRAAAFCRDNQIDASDIIFITKDKNLTGEDNHFTRMTLTLKGGTLDKTQRSLIIKALTDNNWNYTKTASELGIGRTTLWRKIKKYHLQKEPVHE
ncbi:MAG: sigma-54 dependent transcriptional regulator [candidate division Zixibacteria bacterium]|nr:sigma-54 dependent transcriptional regulator [candidate division Zixibacteria bacterium]MDD5427160.1 sigma-54 dependent transcriptional regulator [candidate division Zixibacteria bacterium]